MNNLGGFLKKRPRSCSTVINLILSLYIVVFLNAPFWNRFSSLLGTATAANWFLLVLIGIGILFILNGFFSLLSCKYIFKPSVILILVVAAVVNYYMVSYGIVISKQMITNLLETDIKESAEQLSLPFFLHVLLKAGIPSALLILTEIVYQPWKKELLERASVFIGSITILTLVVFANFKDITLFGRSHPELRMYINPTYPVYSLVKVLAKGSSLTPKEPLKVTAPDATRTPSGHKSLFVLVVGETARAEQFSLNGYSRNTNPELASHDIVNFTDVHSCGTDTAESLPCMFSDLGRGNYSRKEAFKRENLLDILKRTGVNVHWLDNNSGSKGVADRIAGKSFTDAKDPLLCTAEECFDEVMLQDFDKLITENSGDMFLVLHQKGSHGPSYYKRSPANFKKYIPECTQDNVQDCEKQTIINAYDNTILYTDHFLAKLIDRLKKENYPTAMLYVSDHGESLGENNMYLHGMPYSLAPKQQTQVPMIFWGSDSYLKEGNIDKAGLAKQKNLPYSHDFLFHSILGLFRVKTGSYRQELDIFRST
uniref:Lipid A phosphoethanolamine transferase n=1 Tax=uncultured bacterium pAG2 TaxID=1781152 RepID=A0A1C9U4I9_9BACT|nr:lipid A phosphoethanolamine transferase [uncultured bacterium pAG2]